jgi:hypothetical protein
LFTAEETGNISVTGYSNINGFFKGDKNNFKIYYSRLLRVKKEQFKALLGTRFAMIHQEIIRFAWSDTMLTMDFRKIVVMRHSTA